MNGIEDTTPHTLREWERRVQAHALHAMGLTPEDRVAVVGAMFQRRTRDAVGYWLQLMISVGIAILGLALGSTAVVIGAMLISPLMGPIVELGMGLVVGSPVLTVRSFIRTIGSVAAAVGGAGLLTLLLPFHEINPEIASRTFPTLLDLLIATFVALAAAFTTVRSSSETTSAAAGTAIGIALVPPLCVIGFGLGTRDWAVAGGASLLFTANLSAILLIAVLAFLVLGFEMVETGAWEQSALTGSRTNRTTQRVVGGLRAAFGSRYSRVLRVSVPLLLLGGVAVPLTRALDEVAWEVRARTAVSRIISESQTASNAVQSVVSVKGGAVALRLYIVATPQRAADLEDRLRLRIAMATGVDPAVEVVAVPDVDALRQATTTPQAAAVPTSRGAAEAARSLGTALRSVWPGDQVGPLFGWRLETRDTASLRLEVMHLGDPAGPAADALLTRALTERAGTRVVVRTRAYPVHPVEAPADQGTEWLPDLVRALAAVHDGEGVDACIRIPAQQRLDGSFALARVADVVRSEAARLPAGRVEVRPGGDGWSVRLSPNGCRPAASATPGATAAGASGSPPPPRSQ